MPRGMVQSLHHIHFNSWKTLGFTLLELIMTLAIVAILVSAAAPSFKSIIDRNKIQRIAMEIEGFLLQAKSESVMRNEALTIYFVRDSGNETDYHNDGEWVLALMPASTTVTTIASAKLGAISVINGDKHKGVNIKVGLNTHLTMDPVRGSPNIVGQYFFHINDNSKEVKVVLNRLTGRIRICSISGVNYGYKTC